jgi:hypothetical protein
MSFVDKDPSSKFQDPNSKVEVPSPNFKKGDKARGDGATVQVNSRITGCRGQSNSKSQVPNSKI